jgi:hypothetical protein
LRGAAFDGVGDVAATTVGGVGGDDVVDTPIE